MHAPFDHLGRNVLRDFFVLFGAAQPASEVPPTDALEIDLWYVPDPAQEQLRTELTSGVVREIAVEPAVLELYSETLRDRAFHTCLRKRYQWQHVLELRDGKPLALLRVWMTSPTPPKGVIDSYGFVPAEAGPPGHYVMAKAAWRIHILALSELPRTRETVLLRVLGQGQVLEEAIADLLALPDDAWEKKVAVPWLVRLSFTPPKEAAALSDEEKAIMTEIQEWYEQLQHQAHTKAQDDGMKLGVKLGRTQALGRMFERRLGRPLDDGERQVLADRIERLGEDRVDDVILGLDNAALVAWLADPAAS